MRRIFAGLLLFLPLALLGADKMTPLNVKLGLWEITQATTMSGQMPMSPEMLAHLTPEQRAKIEEAMKARAAKPQTHTYKSCITKEKIEKGATFNEHKECTQNLLTSTSTNMKVHITCEMENMKVDGTLDVEALSSESAKGSGHFTMSGSGRSMESTSQLTGKWVSSDCGGVN